MTQNKKVISFLASGRGLNFQAVASKIVSGQIAALPGILVCDRADAPVLEKAKKLRIDSVFIDPKLFSNKTDYEQSIINIMKKYKTDYIVAAGYMRILSGHIINIYKNRIVNIHPSLLPAFPGKDAQKQALEYGVRITGCTTHFIDEGTDTGPIILQKSVNIEKSDNLQTLSEKILKEEHTILIKSIKLLCENRIQINERKVIII